MMEINHTVNKKSVDPEKMTPTVRVDFELGDYKDLEKFQTEQWEIYTDGKEFVTKCTSCGHVTKIPGKPVREPDRKPIPLYMLL